jgi:hypothetical protein
MRRLNLAKQNPKNASNVKPVVRPLLVAPREGSVRRSSPLKRSQPVSLKAAMLALL